jgi:hypothetical protein
VSSVTDVDLRVRGPEFPANTINLPAGGTSELIVTAVPHRFSYEYRLVVSYEVGDAIHEMTIDDGDKPFQVTGLNGPSSGKGSYGAAYLIAGDLSFTTQSDPHTLDFQGLC